MTINKKWGAAAAGLLTIALVGGGGAAAFAAPGDPIKNPQENGSQGSFYIWDENAELGEAPGKVWEVDDTIFASSTHDDILSEIDPDDYATAGSWNQVYKFLAKPSELSGGTGSWRTFAEDGAAGPNGGVLNANLTIGDFIGANGGGMASVLSEGGEWLLGIAFTTNTGVTPVGMVYRTVTVDAATDTFTFKPIEYDVPAGVTVTTQPASQSAVVGGTATFTAAADNDTAVKWQSQVAGGAWTDIAGATSETLTVSNVTLAQTGTQYRAVFAPGDVASNAATLTVSTAPIGEADEPTDANDAATKVAATSTEGSVTLTGVPAGTYNAYAFSVPTPLGSVTVPASGTVTIPLPAAYHGAQHTVALFQPGDNELVAWGNVLVVAPQWPTTSETELTAEVIVSGKFALEGVNAGPVALGTAKRGATTTAVPLGAFTVTDDRNILTGWTLNADVATFTNADNDEIADTALGFAAKKVGDPVAGITTSAAKVAGDAWTSRVIAEGAAESFTSEDGTDFDADLTFKAPANAKKGTYTSTLTLTLAPK